MRKIDLHNYEAYLLDYSEGNLNSADETALRAFLLLHPELPIELDGLQFVPLDLSSNESFDHSSLVKEFDARTESVLNYLEGNLDSAEKTAFEQSLLNDAALVQLVKDFEATFLPIETIKFPAKASLLHDEEALLLANSLLNYVEGQLGAEETIAITAQVEQDPLLANELAAYRSTILQADLGLTYPNKAALIQTPKVIALFSTSKRYYAAAAVLLLLVFAFLIQYTNSAPQNASQLASKSNEAPAPVSKHIQRAVKEPSILQVPSQTLNTNKLVIVQQKDSLISTSPASFETLLPAMQENLLVQTATVPVNVATSVEPQLKNNEPSERALAAQAEVVTNRYHSVDELIVTEDLPEIQLNTKKTDLWHKAVDLARRANNMGLTAVNGEEEKKAKNYRLSFNSFSVEKH